jgi:hypothetical protein
MGRVPLAARDLRPYGTRPEWVSLRSVRKETLAGEARSDDQSDYLGHHQAPRINVQDCQAAVRAHAAGRSAADHAASRAASLARGGIG